MQSNDKFAMVDISGELHILKPAGEAVSLNYWFVLVLVWEESYAMSAGEQDAFRA